MATGALQMTLPCIAMDLACGAYLVCAHFKEIEQMEAVLYDFGDCAWR